MERQHLLTQIREILARAGFSVSEVYELRLTGFDIVARREQLLLIIKVLTNIDSLSEDVAQELRTLCRVLHATPLLIGERNGLSKLEEGVIYDRFGIQAITYESLRNHLQDGTPIRTFAAPGGLYVHLDEEKLRQIRQEKNISLGSFARYVKVTRRTVQMYENGMGARIEVATKIEKLLETPIIRSIDIFQSKHENRQMDVQREKLDAHDFQEEIFSLLEKMGYEVFPLQKCPFEALSKEKEKILLSCVHRFNTTLAKRAQVVGSIAKITKNHAVVFTDKESKKVIKGAPVIVKHELKKIRGPEEIFDLIMERL